MSQDAPVLEVVDEVIDLDQLDVIDMDAKFELMNTIGVAGCWGGSNDC